MTLSSTLQGPEPGWGRQGALAPPWDAPIKVVGSVRGQWASCPAPTEAPRGADVSLCPVAGRPHRQDRVGMASLRGGPAAPQLRCTHKPQRPL